MDEDIQKQLEAIAESESYDVVIRGGLKPLHEEDDEGREDEEDYVSVSVRELARMLERAYELGKNHQ